MKGFNAFLIPVILSLNSVGCFFYEKDPPEALIGKWKTPDPRYSDRFMEIQENLIIFGMGEERRDYGTIFRIDSEKKGERHLYTLFYKNPEGHKNRISFWWKPDHGGVLTFKNQRETKWIQEGNQRDEF